MQKAIDLTENEAAVLDYIRRAGDEIVGYRTLTAPLDMTKSGAYRLCKRMEGKGLLEISASPGGSRINFSKKGAILAANMAAHTSQDFNGKPSAQEVPAPVDVHYVTVRVEYANRSFLQERFEDWRGAWTEKNDYRWMYSVQNDSYSSEPIGVLENTVFQLYRDAARIIIKRPAVAYSVPAAMRETRQRVEDAVQWLNGRSPATANMRGLEIETTHAAAVNHHLAQLVDGLEGIEHGDVTVIDREDGSVRARTEQSRAWPELEFDGAGTAPVDLDRTLEDWLDVFVHEPEVIRSLVEMGRKESGRVEEEQGVMEEGGPVRDAYSYEDWNELDRLRD